MNVTTTALPGLLIIEPKVFGDARGFFFESYSQQRYAEAGLAFPFVQDNFSLSRRGVLRGLHFQNPQAQGKLISVIQGEVYDVAVDLRRSSPTFGRWHAIHLTGESKTQFYIPPGFAHGFQVLSEQALFHYKCTEYYAPANEATLRFDDPALGIPWPLANPELSAKDKVGLPLKDLPAGKLFP
jgi:dTDP-4-dehydrorhamnose 3,5-epimerase